MNRLRVDVEKLSNQTRFLELFITQELLIAGRPKADVVEDLRFKGFRAFPRVVSDEHEADGVDGALQAISDYDYLLGMSIMAMTEEKVCVLNFIGSFINNY